MVGPTLFLCGLRCPNLDDGPFCMLLINAGDCVSYSVSSTNSRESPSLPQGKVRGKIRASRVNHSLCGKAKKNLLWLAEMVDRIFCRYLVGTLFLQPCMETLSEVPGVSLPLLLCSWSQVRVSLAFWGLFCRGRGVCGGCGAGRAQEKQSLPQRRWLGILYLELMGWTGISALSLSPFK